MDAERAAKIEREYGRPWGEFLLWFGMLGSPTAWALHLQVMYVLTQSACKRHTMLPLHVTTALMLALSLLALAVAWRDWIRIGMEWPNGREGGVIGRSRLMAAMGAFLGALFSLLIFAQWIAVFYLSPCVD